jgi:hypothetical protein
MQPLVGDGPQIRISGRGSAQGDTPGSELSELISLLIPLP